MENQNNIRNTHLSTETVVLVDEQNNVIGTAPKATVHGKTTPLHRGFSLFIFNRRGETLLQQRALTKITWPGVWSNSCCGHPTLNETNVQAAARRAADELGLRLEEIVEIAPYRYQCTRNGIEENEICPILVAVTDDAVSPNPMEVTHIRWVQWDALAREITTTPGHYSEWCEDEARILAANKKFNDWYNLIFLRK